MTRVLTAGLVLLALVVPAGASAAPAIRLDRPCYSSATPLTIAGSGFTPGGRVELAATWSSGFAEEPFSLTADAAGAVVTVVEIPQLETEELRLTISARDIVAQTVATATARVSFFGAYYRPWNTDGPARGRPGRVRMLDADGFLDGGSVLYVHYRLGGKVVKTQRLGRLTGDCGSLRRRLREFPFRPVRPGTYRVRFNTSKSWSGPGAWSEYKRVVVGRKP